MNKIFLNNFPYPSQGFTAEGATDPRKHTSFVHGFDDVGIFQLETSRKRLAADILQAVLIHDIVSIELAAVWDLVRVFGFQDALKLLKSGIFEIVDHRGFTPALVQDGSTYSLTVSSPLISNSLRLCASALNYSLVFSPVTGVAEPSFLNQKSTNGMSSPGGET